MGKEYTRAVVEACTSVDDFIDVKDFLNSEILLAGKKPQAIVHVLPNIKIAQRAHQLGIPLRIGTNHRFYHWFTCNSAINLSRKKSTLHEAQLNLQLLEPFGIATQPSLPDFNDLFALTRLQPLPEKFAKLLSADHYNLVLHPKSQGNGREWGIDNFIQLVQLLDPQKFRIFISGVQKERAFISGLFDDVGDRVIDLTGQMNLAEFISFIAAADGLVASGTGPVHLAGALGKDALGIYPPIKPIHPARWAPLGQGAQVFVLERTCNDCKDAPQLCHCIQQVEPMWLKVALDAAQARKKQQINLA